MIKFKYIFYTIVLLMTISYTYGSENGTSNFRLPKKIVPIKYNLRIETSRNNSNSFITIVAILIKCIKPTNIITLHMRGLKVDKRSTIFQSSDKKYYIRSITTESTYDFLHIRLYSNLRANSRYKIIITTSGTLQRQMKGYYDTSYSNGTTATQFEPTYARTMFPCFDEPGFKAKFQIGMLHESHVTALTNMPLKKSVKQSQMIWDLFEESEPMSTYLVAFMLTDFKYQEIYFGNVSIKIWAREEVLHQVKFALNIIPKLLDYYEKYFDIKYNLKKLDVVAMSNFPSEGVGNLGLIFIRESSLLLDTSSSSIFYKEEIMNIVAQKLAQQWFGNLLTMKWWRDVWIKEGFASFFATLAIDHIFPEWQYYKINVLSNVQTVLAADAYLTSQPIATIVSSVKEIEEHLHNVISYKKAALLLRQLEQQLTPDKFKKAIRYLLKKRKYKSVNEDGLWNTLTEYARSSGMMGQRNTYQEMMTPWTVHAGYPIVSVVRNYTKGTVSVKQTRYILNNWERFDTCYWTPLSYVTELQSHYNSSLANLWLKCPRVDITFNIDDMTTKWILFNNQASGLYRVQYDKTNWDMLISQLNKNHTKIDEINRVVLIDDVMKLAKSEHLSYDVAFSLIDYIVNEEKYMPWKTAINNLNIIANYLENTPTYQHLQKYIINRLTPAYKKFSKVDAREKENGEILKFQELLLKTACYFELKECIASTTNLYSLWMSQNNPFPSHLREVVYCNGVKYGGENEWNFLWTYYQHAKVEIEKQEILTALGCSRDTTILNRYLHLSVSTGSEIKQQNVIRVVSGVAKNLIGTKVVTEFIYEYIKINYNKIERPVLVAYLKIIGDVSKTENELNEFKNFILQYFKEQTDDIKRILLDIEYREKWFQTNSNQINQILIELNTPPPINTPRPKYKRRKRKNNKIIVTLK